MNIYIHVEIAARELPSKLVLAILAVQQGHNVMLSDLNSFRYFLKKNRLPPGIFHDKALTPTSGRLKLYQELRSRGFLITSLDEEHGLLSDSYEGFAKARYSNASLELASRAFCWGDHDHACLKSIYASMGDRFEIVGSPRADIWAGIAPEVDQLPDAFKEKPYLLFSSNFSINAPETHWRALRRLRAMGYLEREPSRRLRLLSVRGEQFRLMAAIAEVLEKLSRNMPDVSIVIRPHPIEDSAAWKEIMRGMPNVHVIREGSIGPWVHGALAVIHNGCTTAFEAALAGKPVLTLRPLRGLSHEREVPNRLGVQVANAEEIEACIRGILVKGEADFLERIEKDRLDVRKRILLVEGETAAKRIIDSWNQLGCALQKQEKPKVFGMTSGGGLWMTNFLARSRRHLYHRLSNHDRFVANEKFPALRKGNVEQVIVDLSDKMPASNVGYRVVAPRALALFPQ